MNPKIFATLSYNKENEALVYKRDKYTLITRLYNCNGKLCKVNQFNKGYLALQLQDKQGKEYEEYIPLDNFLSDLGQKKNLDKYFKGINKTNLIIKEI